MDFEVLGATAASKQPVWVIQPDPKSEGFIPTTSRRVGSLFKTTPQHGLLPTNCHAVRMDIASIDVAELFVQNRKVATTSSQGLKLTRIAEALSELSQQDKKQSVLIPRPLATRIDEYKKRYKGDTQLLSVTPAETLTYPLTETKNPLTLPPVFISDAALLSSLDIPLRQCHVVPTRATYYDAPFSLEVKQSRGRSNCYFTATLTSLMNNHETVKELLNNITINTHAFAHCAKTSGHGYTTFTIVFRDHYTKEPVPVTVTCDLLFDQYDQSLYSISDVTLYPLVEKCFHGYLVAKTIQLTELFHQLRPAPKMTALSGATHKPKPIIRSQTQVTDTDWVGAANELLSGDKRSILDLGRASLAYETLSLSLATKPDASHLLPYRLLDLEEEDLQLLHKHIDEGKAAVIGSKKVLALHLGDIFRGLKPNHMYAVLSTGYQDSDDNIVSGFFIYDPYGEQHADLRELKIEVTRRTQLVHGNLTSSALKFIPTDHMSALFQRITLYG